jgi:SAM-dependent methyltransferase
MRATSSSRPSGNLDDWDQHWLKFASTSDNGPATKYRRRLIVDALRIPDPVGDLHLLDIGSGTGGFAEEFCAKYPDAHLFGLELSQAGVEIASRRVSSASFLVRNLLEPVKPQDIPPVLATHAVCSEVLEHLDEPEKLLVNATAYMAPGCRLVVTVPGGPMCDFDRAIGHRTHFTADSLSQLLTRAGFEVEGAYGAGFPFFILYRLSLVARGQHLMGDVSVGANGAAPWHVRFGGLVFDQLFRFNLPVWGWQMVAIARFPG